MSVTRVELDALCRIAEDAGREIMQIYHEGGQIWRKGDDSPLTEADLRADRVIRQGLEQHFPKLFILSEESVSSSDQDSARFFLVDPLDGTKEFLKRNAEFTVNIALVEFNQPVAGVVLAPALGEMYFAGRELGAWKRDISGVRSIKVATVSPSDPLRVIGSRSHGGEKLSAWLATLKTEHTFVAAGSSLKFCQIAEGRADIYPRFGPTSQWDTAAAQAILEIAGGAVTSLEGDSLLYGLDRPILNTEFVAVAQMTLLSLFEPGNSQS